MLKNSCCRPWTSYFEHYNYIYIWLRRGYVSYFISVSSRE